MLSLYVMYIYKRYHTKNIRYSKRYHKNNSHNFGRVKASDSKRDIISANIRYIVITDNPN